MTAQVMESVSAALVKRANNAAYQLKVDEGKGQLPAIKKRLERWGEWVVSNRSDCGSASSMLAAWADGGGIIVRSTAGGVNIPDEVYDTEKAVNRLEPKYQQVVYEKYLELGRTDEQRAKSLGVSRSTFARSVVAAQQQILYYLKPPARKASVRDSMLKGRQR